MARARDILCQGRGSAANSAVCYCLGITAVDPARTQPALRALPLRRAPRAARHRRRLRARAPRGGHPGHLRDVRPRPRRDGLRGHLATAARARCARWARSSASRSSRSTASAASSRGGTTLDGQRVARSRRCGLRPEATRAFAQVLALARAIQGFPRHLSIHVGGFVLSRGRRSRTSRPSSRRRCRIAPSSRGTRTTSTRSASSRSTCSASACSPRSARRSISLIASRRLVRRVRGRRRIDRDRPARAASRPRIPRVYDALCEADTVGVFQIESRAQMAMLPRLRPRTLLRSRHRGRDRAARARSRAAWCIRTCGGAPARRRVDPPHPILAPILERTLGVPLFQEQVMQIAIVGAGYTGGEADQLRRDMAAWREDGQARAAPRAAARRLREARHLARVRRAALPADPGLRRVRLPRDPRGELRAPRLRELVAQGAPPGGVRGALINSQPMGFYSPSHDRARTRSGTASRSRRSTSTRATGTARLEGGDRDLDADPPALRLGLRLVGGLGEEAGRRIETRAAREARSRASRISSRGRSSTGEKLDALARAGALAAFGLGRREAMWKTRAPRERDLLRWHRFRRVRCQPCPRCRAPSSSCSTIEHRGDGGRPRHERRAPEAPGALQERARSRRPCRTART